MDVNLGFAQKDNEMLSNVVSIMKAKGFPFRMFHSQDIHRLFVGGRREIMRFLGSIRPHRLLGKFDPDSKVMV